MLTARRLRAFVRLGMAPVEMDSCQDMCLVDCMMDGVSLGEAH